MSRRRMMVIGAILILIFGLVGRMEFDEQVAAEAEAKSRLYHQFPK